MLDLASTIIEFESGELSDTKVVELFMSLANSGTLFQLQGSYQRTYRALLEAGYLCRTQNGTILGPQFETL
jgi:hypothetical protein